MKKLVYRCRDCNGKNVHGQASTMLPLNDPVPDSIPMADCYSDDYNYCMDCQDDCKVVCVEEEEEA
jgi:hypothetical protein